MNRVRDKEKNVRTALILNGSPRKGNSAYLSGLAAEEAAQAGWEVRDVRLNSLQYRGCQACNRCKTKLAKCALDDDLAAVLEWMREADLLVMASPVYYGDVSAQLKGFIDRTFSFLHPEYYSRPDPSRLDPGKKLLFILSQGNSVPYAFDDVFPRYARFFKVYGYTDIRLVRALGVYAPHDAAGRDALAGEVRETTRALLG